MLDSLFRPKSVAVIGASTKELSIGNRVIRNLVDFGFKGPVFPINPKADEVRGIKAYKSILDAPDNIDVVHMVIPAKFVPMAVEDCGKKGVKNIIINSGGFSEIGPEGDVYEKAFLEKAKEYNIRVLGPNCQGIINTDPDVRAYCNITFTKPDMGHISIVALSGGVAEVIHQGFSAMGVGTRIYASNGNACDITIPEIIQYLGDDDGTRVIVTYVEGLRDPATFMKVAREVAAKKPILAMKAGRTLQGAKAAASHTGGLAKEDLATDLIFKKAGVLIFMDEGELIQAAAAFASQPIPKGNRVGIITNTGGPAVIATDILVGAGVEIPPLSQKTEALLKESLFPEASVNNPVDVLATGNAAHYRTCMDAMMADASFDALYINFVTPFFVDTESIAKEIAEVNQMGIKPMVCNLMTDKKQWAGTTKILMQAQVPTYALPGEAARAMTALVRYQGIRARNIGEPVVFDDVDIDKVSGILSRAKDDGRSFLGAGDVYDILGAYGIPSAQWSMATTAEQGAAAAEDLGYPVVVKADASTIIHKSDMGAVAINLNNADEVRTCITEMGERFKADDLTFLIQKYLPEGMEIILGAKVEPGLGHLIMFGMGGIYVEVLKDVVFNLTPVTAFEADEMLGAIQLSPILKGVRGQKGVFRAGITDILLRLSQLVSDHPVIQELDLNPTLAFEDKVVVVDGRISI